MAEHMRASLNKSNKFYGTLVCSHSPACRINKLTVPDLDERYFTLRRSDFEGAALLSVFSGTIPLLNEEKIYYDGQPIMAIFGPDSEASILMARQVDIETVPIESEKVLDLDEGLTDSLTMGSPAEIEEEVRTIKTTVSSKSTVYTSPSNLICECWQEGDRIHIEVPTQWPALIRKNVAAMTEVPEANVIVHNMPYQSLHDEYLIQPAVLACIGVQATLKCGLPVVMRGQAWSVSPEITIERTTRCGMDGRPIDEECTLTAHLGAWALDDAEFIRQSFAGLLPNYPLQQFKATITTHRSATFPSLIYSGAGFSDALYSAERHATLIANSFETPPAKWKEHVYTGRRPFCDYLPSIDLDQLAKLDDEMIEKSDFNRKWASYCTQRDEFDLLPFNRGIGLASGFSIAGFSTSFAKENPYQARITLTEKGNVTLLTSFPAHGGLSDLVSKTVAAEMDRGDKCDCILLDNDGTLIDCGPDILCRATGHFPIQLSATCVRLNLEGQEPPVTLVFGCDETLMPCEFEQRGMASVIVETRLDNISFTPEVLEVWVTVAADTNISAKELNGTIRKQVISTLEECGAHFTRNGEKPFRINIIRREWSGGSLTSLDAALRGLTKASFVSSLKLSLSNIEESLPVSPAAIEKAYRERGNANEN